MMPRLPFTRRAASWSALAPAFEAYLLARRKRPSTARTYLAGARHFAEWCELSRVELSRVDALLVSAYVAALLRARARNTVALRVVVLRAFFSFLVAAGYRKTSPMTRDVTVSWEEPPPRQPLTLEDVRRLLDAGDSDRDRAMITLVYDTGLRLSELIGLREEAIDFVGGLVYFRGKGGKIGFAAPSTLALEQLRPFCGHPSGVLWRTPDGRPLSGRGAQWALQAIARRAGVGRVHWHRLRTTYANAVLGAGVPLEDLQQLMRHASSGTTRHYAGATINARAFAAARQLELAAQLALPAPRPDPPGGVVDLNERRQRRSPT